MSAIKADVFPSRKVFGPLQSFERWKHRPVYLTQCRTFAVAVEMGLGSRFMLRTLPPYRDAETRLARGLLALQLRILRLRARTVQS